MEKITDIITEGQTPCIPHCCIQTSAHTQRKSFQLWNSEVVWGNNKKKKKRENKGH